MAHEIEKNDGLALAETGAWHGLGTVVSGAMNPYAALRTANLEWEVVESKGVSAMVDGSEVTTGTHKMLIRSDDRTVLGVVGADYSPVQNATLADLAYALRSQSDGTAEVESAGSIRGGRRVWMLLRGKSVSYGHRDDEVATYLFISNGHDGSMALSCCPTNTRVVCANTFRAALNRAERAGSILRFRHTSRIGDRVDELKRCIQQWQNTIEDGRVFAGHLHKTSMNRDKVRSLWLDVIERIDGEIPDSPKNGWEERSRDHAVQALAHMSQVFDEESQRFGATGWVAVNAATNWIQHVRPLHAARTKDAQERAYSAWDGSVQRLVGQAFGVAKEVLL